MRRICVLTGETFAVTPEEMALRKKFGVEGEPELHPKCRFMQLAAFWQHWNLHKRMCDRTGKSIISVFSEHCPYPVWHKDEWLRDSNPPSAVLDPSQRVFEQMWELFRQCPIAHNTGVGNENCEYTDDWWYSRNCYLCHSGLECEDLRCCYRTIRVRNSQYCVFSFDSERCLDLINCHDCFQVLFAYNSRSCSDSSFLYDCRNCSHCAFSCNLRNKQYCFLNEQLTKDAYERRLREWDFRSRSVYECGTAAFHTMLRERAWHRSLFIDQCEHAQGNYLDESKNITNGYFLSNGMEDCAHTFRGAFSKDCLDCVSPYAVELVYCSTIVQDKCYDVRFCFNLTQCKWMEYCAHCYQCQHCFACCGLVGKKYHILNKSYEPEEYEALKAKMIEVMRANREYGKFFPGRFAANPYVESLAFFYWPFDDAALEKLGFRLGYPPPKSRDPLQSSAVPDHSGETTSDLTTRVYWDDVVHRPFRIQQQDIEMAQSLGVPLPSSFYSRRLSDNFRLIPFSGELRKTQCGQCKQAVHTSWPEEFDGRILCEKCYLKEVY
jgi:hypothetical protein